MKAMIPLLVMFLGLATVNVDSSLQAQESYSVSSPDGALTLVLTPGEALTYSILWEGRTLVEPSPLSMAVSEGGGVQEGVRVVSSHTRSVDTELRPVVPEKRAVIRDHFNELSVELEGGWGLELRAYDDGVAYRFRTETEGPFEVQAEGFSARLSTEAKLWFPREESLLTHQERSYEEIAVGEVEVGAFASIPVLVAPPGLPKLLITESDLRDYPGMYLQGTGGDALEGLFPAYPLTERQERDRTVRVTERAEVLARTSGPRSFPWRLFIVAEEDRELVESTLVYQLGPELQIQDPSWIRPGKVAWDWWNASGLHGVDFTSGLNADTYLHFIDFAADHGIQYVILDEGWSNTLDFSQLNPDMDVPALLARAKERGVGLILWVVWTPLRDDLEGILDQFAAWGAAGVKVDFMQRDDQPVVNYYWEVAKAAAQRHLLVDFHGAYKPAGLRRAYPNVITREGVMGLEHSKWSTNPTPTHNVTLPFIRMVAGPMDYTPGAMRNAQEEQFNAVFDRPMSLGTRVHQMAMYVVFESPLQMLADSPSNYADEPECLAFIVPVPTVWDETRVLSGQVGEWIAVARRSGEDWYVAAMTNWTPRELALDLSFLGPGSWQAEVFQDGANARRNAEDYRRVETLVNPGEPLQIRLAPGGGWVAKISPTQQRGLNN